MFKDFFQKKKYAVVPMGANTAPNKAENGTEDRPKREIPEGLMNRCSKCGNIQFTKELEKNLKVCSTCGHHFRLNAWERIAMTIDEGTFAEVDANLVSEDPLDFPGYKKKLKQQTDNSGLKDAIVTGTGEIAGYPVVIGVMSFDFFSGSMGSVVGEKIARAIELADEKGLPLLVFSTSGGARMQESILSLMQMAKTSAALAKFQDRGGLFISVFTDPTMGGVSASFASLGDYNLAEPGAVVGFAGRLVIEQTIRQKLPDNFQTAEFNLKHGQLDKVVHRKDMKTFLGKLLDMHAVKGVGTDVR
ncbi:acetyl-CoA carboxylase, carboxyltransferase subunit beta [Cohnella sp. AR92]|uniref:acetyl-CoA carboxylase, carboxyltransferase subunit beta n=1 Tax=Cohnella sp. AR92 TaxID=648716 RepID=UPI000F8CBA78|nr:acetyl-CoA carboxylase, carboxyltransferase subunit beta [Cohnella sp. AR92]RUS44543.1 acetyl-CoA carboxylase carboxyltransferase subunit beta [Cohnella sp. AR92]